MSGGVVQVTDGLVPEVGLSIARGWAHETFGTRGVTARILAWLATAGPTDTTWWEVGPTMSTVGVVGEPGPAVAAMRTIIARIDDPPHLPAARPLRPNVPDGRALQQRWGWRGFGLYAAPHLGHAELTAEQTGAWLAGVGTRSATLWTRNLDAADLALPRAGRPTAAVDPAWRDGLAPEEATVDGLFTISWLEGGGAAAARVSQWWARHLVELLPEPVPGQPALAPVRRTLLPHLHHVTLAATGRFEADDVEAVREAVARLRTVDPPPGMGPPGARAGDGGSGDASGGASGGAPPEVWTRLWGPLPDPADDGADPVALGRAGEDLVASLRTAVPPDIAQEVGLVPRPPGHGVVIEGRGHQPVPGAQQLVAMPRRRLVVGDGGVGMSWHAERARHPDHVGVPADEVVAVLRFADDQRLVVGDDDTRLVLDPAYWSHAARWLPAVDALAPELVELDEDGPVAPWSEIAARSVLAGWGAWLAVVVMGAVGLGYAAYGLVAGVAPEELPYLLGLAGVPLALSVAVFPTARSWLRLRRRVARQLGGPDRLVANLSPPPTR